MSNTKSFKEEILDNLIFVDPDSTRFAEIMYAQRTLRAGKPTHLNNYRLPDTSDVSTEILGFMVKDYFTIDGKYDYFVSPNYFRALKINEEGRYIELYVTVTCNDDSNYVVTAIGDKDVVEAIINKYKTTYKTPNTITISNLIGFSSHGPEVTQRTLNIENQRLANKEFYPYIPELQDGIDNFVKEFMSNSASNVIFYGPPGTGKSTLIRTILFTAGREIIGMSNNFNTQMDTGFIPWVESLGSEAIIGLEDADMLILSREQGNNQMAAILNMTDGVIQTNMKMIISTNLASLNKTDSALIRRGRTFKVLKFDYLTPDQANVARESIGLKPINFKTDKITLSDALSMVDDEVESNKPFKMGII